MPDPKLTRVTISEAVTISERSDKTLRRWLQRGRLTRHEGVSANGGTPPILIDRDELMLSLVQAGQQPRPVTTQRRSPPDQVRPPIVDYVREHNLEVQLAQAKAATEIARAEGKVVALEVELSVVRDRLADMERQVHQAATREEMHRLEVSDWKDRLDAKEAELAALRAQRGLSWWHRLLPG